MDISVDFLQKFLISSSLGYEHNTWWTTLHFLPSPESQRNIMRHPIDVDLKRVPGVFFPHTLEVQLQHLVVERVVLPGGRVRVRQRMYGCHGDETTIDEIRKRLPGLLFGYGGGIVTADGGCG